MAALAADTTLFEPNRPQIVRKEIALRRWPGRLEGFTIALLSDFHYDPYFSVHPLRASISMVNDLHPDLIALAGDFVSEPFLSHDRKKAASAAVPCAHFLQQMHAPYGLWAVLGNHDLAADANLVVDALRAEGIQVLERQRSQHERREDASGSAAWTIRSKGTPILTKPCTLSRLMNR